MVNTLAYFATKFYTPRYFATKSGNDKRSSLFFRKICRSEKQYVLTELLPVTNALAYFAQI